MNEKIGKNHRSFLAEQKCSSNAPTQKDYTDDSIEIFTDKPKYAESHKHPKYAEAHSRSSSTDVPTFGRLIKDACSA